MKNERKEHILLVGSSAVALLNFRGPLVRDISNAGHRISVSAPNFSSAERQQLEEIGAEVYDIPLSRTGINPFSDFFYMKSLLSLLKRIQPDKLVTYTIKPNIWGAFAAAIAGIPSYAMITGLGYIFTENAAKPSLKKRFLRAASRVLYRNSTAFNTRVIFQNPDDRNDFLRLGCLKDNSKAALVNGSGVDMDHYSRAPLSGEPYFLMVARLLKAKGVREYAEAALTLLKRYPNAHFRIVGYFDEGHDTISRRDMESWVAAGLDYAGAMADIRPAMSAASVYVLPSYREGTPRSVLEAMAMGRPVVTTDVPGCRETVEQGKNGYLVPPRDSTALAAAMEHFIINPSQISIMGEKAWLYAHTRYEVGKVNRELMQIIGLKTVTNIPIYD